MEQPQNENVEFFCHRCNRQFRAQAQPDVRCSVCNDDFVEMMPSAPQRRPPRRFGLDFPSPLGRALIDPQENAINAGNFSVQVTSDQGNASILSGVLPLGELAESGLFPDTLVATIYQFFDLLPSGPPPATSEDIRRLNNYEITQEDLDNQRECPICMESFRLNEQTKCLPCKHAFHERCITQWLELRGTCPVCRRTLQGTDTSRQEFFLPLENDESTRDLSTTISDGNLAVGQRRSDTRSTMSSHANLQSPEEAGGNLVQSVLRPAAAEGPSDSYTLSGRQIRIPRNGTIVRATVSARLHPVGAESLALRNAQDRSTVAARAPSPPAAGASEQPTRPSTLQSLQSRLGSAARTARFFTRMLFPEENTASSERSQQSEGNADQSTPLQDDLD